MKWFLVLQNHEKTLSATNFALLWKNWCYYIFSLPCAWLWTNVWVPWTEESCQVSKAFALCPPLGHACCSVCGQRTPESRGSGAECIQPERGKHVKIVELVHFFNSLSDSPSLRSDSWVLLWRLAGSRKSLGIHRPFGQSVAMLSLPVSARKTHILFDAIDSTSSVSLLIRHRFPASGTAKPIGIFQI